MLILISCGGSQHALLTLNVLLSFSAITHFVLILLLQVDENSADYPKLSRIENYGYGETIMAKNLSGNHNVQLDNIFGIDPFYIEKGNV